VKFTFSSTDIHLTHRDRAALLAAVRQRLVLKEGFALATLNLDHIVKLHLSSVFRRAYAQHELVVADGNPVVWLSRLAKRPVSLVPGSELIEPMCEIAAEDDVPVALIGSTSATLAMTAARLVQSTPGLRIVLQIAPAFGFDPEGDAADQILEQIRDSGAQLCFVALGAPKQEIFAARGRRVVVEAGFVSVGAGLDFIAGRQRRAPVWMRRLAMEWLWRLLQDPRRLLPRYLTCIAILPGEIWRALKLRFYRRSGR
jgi:N-acetylglucosaminyldiphosphoundecaprenol N-acetyl-beta-D-mannosaminyltransferase